MLVTNAVMDSKSVVFQQKDSEVRMCTDVSSQWVRSFSMAGAGRGRSRDVIDGPGPTGLARGKRTVTVIAYRLFHSPAKDLRYSAAANHINRQRSTLQ